MANYMGWKVARAELNRVLLTEVPKTALDWSVDLNPRDWRLLSLVSEEICVWQEGALSYNNYVLRL